MDYIRWIFNIYWTFWIFMLIQHHTNGCMFHSKMGTEVEADGVRFIRLREDMPIGSEVFTIQAYPRSSVILKSMDRTPDFKYFKVKELNMTTIQVVLTKTLDDLVDRDVPQNLLKFKIECLSRTSRSEESSFMGVTVYVEDVNDHSPKFLNLPYSVTVDEATPVGTTIYQGILAFDRDKPNTPNSDIQYSLGAQDFGPGGPYFSLDSPHRPSLVLRRKLDFDEGIRFFDLQIIATDRGTPPKSTNETMKIKVLDSDDLPPKFTEGVYRTRINEFAPLTGIQIKMPLNFDPPIMAYDQDSLNASLVYDIISGNERKLFWVNPLNGVIFLEREIDLEEESLPGNTFVLQLEARQKDSPQKRALVRIEIEVNDLNDNAPEFEVDLYNISIVENLPSGFSVLQVNAIDRDQGENAEFFYQITKEEPEGAFLIDPRSGWITVRDQSLLDRETRQSLSMIVDTVEKVEPHSSREEDAGSVFVEITLLDSNDNTPEFEGGNLYDFRVDVNAPIGQAVGQVRATDPDEGRNGMLLYDIQRPKGSGILPFKVDPHTGTIVVASKLKRGRIALFVEATDQPTNPSERRFALAVVTVEIVPDKISEMVDFIGSPYQFWVGSDAPIGTSVGQIRTTLDWDIHGQVMYDLLHSYVEGVPFAVEERSGIVTVIRDLEDFDRSHYDFEAVATLYDSDNKVRRRSTKNNRQVTQSGEVIEIDEGVISNTDDILVTNVTIRVVNADDERGILMRGTIADPIEFHVKENIAGALIGQLLYKNMTREEKIAIEESTNLSTVREAFRPKPLRKSRMMTSKFKRNETRFDNKIRKTKRRHRDASNSFSVAVAPTIFYDDPLLDTSHIPYSLALSQSRPHSKQEIVEFESQRQVVIERRSFDNGFNRKPRTVNPENTEILKDEEEEEEEVLITPRPINYKRNSRASTTHNLLGPKNETSVVIERRLKSPKQIAQRSLKFLIANQQDVTDRITITEDGTLKTLQPLDREERDVYRLTVIAEYSKGFVSGAGIYQVTIHVDDENDNPPEFNHYSYTAMISENSPLGTELFLNQPIIAKDKDLGKNAEFSVSLEGEGSDLFIVELVNNSDSNFNRSNLEFRNPFDGLLKNIDIEKSFAKLQIMFMDTNNYSPTEPHYIVRFVGPRKLDRETENYYNLKLIAKDHGNLQSEAKLAIFIADVNDNSPMFEKIAVFRDSGIEVLEHNDDLDIYYANRFESDVLTYPLNKHKDPDRIKYEVTSTVTKKQSEPMPVGTPRRMRSRKRKTRMAIDSPLFALNENAGVGIPILKVTALDEDYEDNGQVFYSINSETIFNNPKSQVQAHIVKFFSIDRLSGEVRVNRPLLAESEIHLNISASDIGDLRDYTIIRFKVIDVNDHPPVFKKSFYSFDINEGVYKNHTIGVVEAIDNDYHDNGRVRYSILSNEKLPFTVNPSLGTIIISGDLDREERGTYEFKVMATDSGPKESRLTAATDVEINVVDVNDNSPEFTGFDEVYSTSGDSRNNLTDKSSDLSSKIPVYIAYLDRSVEPGTFVKQATAIDRDFSGNGNGLVMYSLNHHKQPYLFEIDSREGTIKTITRFNKYPGYEHINLTIIATDLGNPTRSSTALLLINLQGQESGGADEIESRLFPHRYYELEILENNVYPMLVLQINATDAYKGEQFKWSIVPEMEILKNHEFKIDANNGTLWLLKSLDRETKDVYKLKIRAEKLSREGRNSAYMKHPGVEHMKGLMENEIRIVIRVADVNDNPPKFRSNGRPIIAVIPNSANFGYPVAKVEAYDPDAGINAEIRYSLINEPTKLFSIDGVTGRIRLLGPPSLSQRVYGFDVKATDRRGADDGKSAITNVFIYILDEYKQVRLVIYGKPLDVEKEVGSLTKSLSDATGYEVRVRMLEPHTGDKEAATDVYLYAVDPRSNTVVDMEELQHVMAALNMYNLSTSAQILELSDLGSFKANKRHSTHTTNQNAGMNGTELASIVLGIVVFAGSLATALCVICIRYKRRQCSTASDTGLAYSITRAGSTLGAGDSKSSGSSKHIFKESGTKYYTGKHDIHHRDYIDVPLPQSVLTTNYNLVEHDPNCIRFNQMHNTHQTMNVDTSVTSLHSSGLDSGLDLSREYGEQPPLRQFLRYSQRDRGSRRSLAHVSVHNGYNHSPSNSKGDEESSDSYEDSLKNAKMSRQTSLPRNPDFEKIIRRTRHSFSGVRDDLIIASPNLFNRQRLGGGLRHSVNDLGRRLPVERGFHINTNSNC